MLFRKLAAIITVLVFVLLTVLQLGGNAGAQSTASIAQSFQTDETNLVAGALVSLKTDSSNIELSTTQNAERLAGIVGSNALVEVSDGQGTVQVVTDGVTQGLVSDINGTVKEGDHLTASPIEGVGMKTAQSGVVVGTAEAGLDSVSTIERTITDQDGKSRTVHIGTIPVRVKIVAFIVKNESAAPGFLQGLANNIAGRPVSASRVLFATLLFALLFVTVTMLLYVAIQSSIIAIGRNPYSEGVLRKTLLQTGLMVAGITILGLGAVFLVLKL